ncbi:DUF4129 domain-containing protein [Paenibacillus ginsengihumi]|uniref:DUF4129 domain-containing protein n=1 Tax=Paenibacillus ginsengihumi TaxID=431596 RepID=UPI00035E6E92|nr:DUF4129 domain-containing protein [Paenibacillus ginsengihumi]
MKPRDNRSKEAWAPQPPWAPAWSSLIRAALQGAAELLMFLPLALIAAAYALPDGAASWAWIASLPIQYAVGYAVWRFLPIRRRVSLYLLLLLIALAGAYAAFGAERWLLLLLTAPPGFLMAFRGAQAVSEPWHAAFPASLYVIGLAVYFLSSVVLRFMDSFDPYMPALFWGGFASLLLGLVRINQSNVRQETLSGGQEPSLPAALLWQNRLLVAALFAVVLLAAGFGAIRRAAFWLLAQAAGFARWLISLLPESSGEGASPPPAPPGAPELGPVAEPAAWWLLLEKIAVVAAIVIAAAAACALAYWLARRLYRWARQAYDWLRAALQWGERLEANEGYEDDVERLVSWQELNGHWASRLKQWLTPDRKARWSDLTDNRERIRFLYRAMLEESVRRGYVFKAHLTPRETERDLQRWQAERPRRMEPLIGLYERVRYGRRDASDEEVRAAKEMLEGK